MGPGGMPDLSKLTPRQMQQMQSMMPASVRQQMQQPGAMEAAMEMMRNMGGGGGPGGGMPDLVSEDSPPSVATVKAHERSLRAS